MGNLYTIDIYIYLLYTKYKKYINTGNNYKK